MGLALRPCRVAGATALLGVAALAIVGFRIATYASPNDGGTDITGLFFAIVIVVGVVALIEAALLAAFAKWGPSAVWPRRILTTGVAVGGLASLSAFLFEAASIPAYETRLWELVNPLAMPLFGATLLFLVLGLAGTGLGLVATLAWAVTAEG